MSINTPFGKTLIIDKANLPDNIYDFYKHVEMGIMPYTGGPHTISNTKQVRLEMKLGHYLKFMSKIQLLTSAGKIDFKEAGRLLSMMDSKDPENWTVAEECINQKISEL